MGWFFLILSAIMFSSAFLFQRLFQKRNGSSLKSSMEYLFLGSIVVCVTMPIIGKTALEFTWFSFGLALLYSLNGFALTFWGIKAFRYANLSVYSMFMMLGSIVIPSIFSVFFYDERLTLMRLISFCLILASLYLSVQKGKADKYAILYYILVFTLNGMAGVLSKIHQSFESINVSTNNFLLMAGIIKLIASGGVLGYLYIRKKEQRPSVKTCGFAIGGGLLNAIGNYFNLFALISVPVMIHSVVTTGMVLVGSAAIGLFIKEKLSTRAVISILFALAATVFSAI